MEPIPKAQEAQNAEHGTEDQTEHEPPTIEEIREAIQKLANNKSPGSDKPLAEFLKNGGEELVTGIQLFSNIWRQKTVPAEWNVGILCTIYKKVI